MIWIVILFFNSSAALTQKKVDDDKNNDCPKASPTHFFGAVAGNQAFENIVHAIFRLSSFLSCFDVDCVHCDIG